MFVIVAAFRSKNILSIKISEAKDETLNDIRRDGSTRRPSPRKVHITRVINLVSYSLSIIKGKRPHSFKCVPKEAILPDWWTIVEVFSTQWFASATRNDHRCSTSLWNVTHEAGGLLVMIWNWISKFAAPLDHYSSRRGSLLKHDIHK